MQTLTEKAGGEAIVCFLEIMFRLFSSLLLNRGVASDCVCVLVSNDVFEGF